MEQLSIFESETTDEQLEFYGHYCNKDWSVKTKTVNGEPNIVDSIVFNLAKDELKSICFRAVKVNAPRIYGYEVFFEDDGVKKKIFVRFGNFTTKKKWSVFEYIDLYFDTEVSWYARNKKRLIAPQQISQKNIHVKESIS